MMNTWHGLFKHVNPNSKKWYLVEKIIQNLSFIGHQTDVAEKISRK